MSAAIEDNGLGAAELFRQFPGRCLGEATALGFRIGRSLEPTRRLLLLLQIRSLEGANHRNQEPVVGLIGVGTFIWFS
jgi:hypothetical protein